MSRSIVSTGCKIFYMITIQEIQKNIAIAIKQSGMTQTELGQKLGVSQQTISHYIKGDKLPALDTFANLCKVLEIDPGDILSKDTF